jgi:hypothetical protein
MEVFGPKKMAESDDGDSLKRWARIMSKGHSYAGVFNYENSEDKGIVELSTVEEWCRSILAEYGLEVDALIPNHDDPPDFFVTIEGQQRGVELVQLVDQENKMRAVKEETPFAAQLFIDMQWSRERFLSKLKDVLAKKGEKYGKYNLYIDVLLIHTAEPWLTSCQAQAWLDSTEIEPHPSIGAVYLLFEYEPGGGVDHWPVLMVYGDVPRGANGS